MPDRDLDFATPAWLDALGQIIRTRLAGAANAPFSMCEVFADCPPELGGVDGRVAWHCRVDGDEVDFVIGEVDAQAVDHKLVFDYETVLPIARTVFADDPAAGVALQQEMAEALADGRLEMHGDRSKAPAPMAGVHDEIARRTR